MDKKSNKEQKQPMTCQKQDHYNSNFIYFKFCKNKEEILQCDQCMLDDPQLDQKISINQIMNLPISKIKNYPPIKDSQNKRNIKEVLQERDVININQQKEEINNQIIKEFNKIEQKIFQVINILKKNYLQQIEEIFEKSLNFNPFDIEPLKNSLSKFQKSEIELEELFNVQFEMSKRFEVQENIDKFLGKEKELAKLNKQVENLEKQLQKKVKVFEEQIYISDDEIYQIDQYDDSIQNQDQYQNQQIQFYKSMWNNEHKVQENIKIKQNDQKNGCMTIKFDGEKYGLEQQVYSQILNKKATYHLRMKLNLFGENRQNVVFFLLDYKNRNIEWGGQNQIMISSYQGYTNAGNVIEKAANGQNFSKFMKDNETVYNIVFDYSRKLFQVYDDDKKCQIKTVLDTEKIKGGMVFGMDFYQYYQKKAVYEILEINVKQNHMK